MKLLYCPKCNDVIRLIETSRQCQCGKVSGHYVDNLNAVYFGGVPLGFNNHLFLNAIDNQPKSGNGLVFEAFVIPRKCSTFVRLNKKKG